MFSKFLLTRVCLTVLMFGLAEVALSRPLDSMTLLEDAEQTGINNTDNKAPAKLEHLISEIERRDGQFSIELYRPLRQLSGILQRDGRFQESVDIVRRMQNIVHRVDGVHSAMQMESIDLLIHAFVSQGMAKEVDQQHSFRYSVAVKNYEPESSSMQIARLRLADWYRDSLRYDEAMNLYDEIMNHNSEDDTSLEIRVLRSQALTAYLSGRCCASEKLKEVHDIVSADDSYDEHARVKASLDFLEMKMLEDHQRAPQMLSSIPGVMPARFIGYGNPRILAELVTESIAGPMVGNRRVYDLSTEEQMTLSFKPEEEQLPVAVGAPLPMCSSVVQELATRNPGLKGLYVDVSMSIDSTGKPHDINLDGNVPIKLKRFLRQSLKAGRFLPARNADGSFAESQLSFRQTFDNSAEAVALNSVTGWNQLMVNQSCGVLASI